MPSSACQTCALDRKRSEEHTCELQSHDNVVCRLLLEKKDGGDTLPARSSNPRNSERVPRKKGGRPPSTWIACHRTSFFVLRSTPPSFSVFFFNGSATPGSSTSSPPGSLRI